MITVGAWVALTAALDQVQQPHWHTVPCNRHEYVYPFPDYWHTRNSGPGGHIELLVKFVSRLEDILKLILFILAGRVNSRHDVFMNALIK